MTAFIQEGAPVIVQGMTGHQGMTHTARMLRAGTNIVGGVNPRKAGSQVTFEAASEGRDVSVPVYATCAEAKEATGAQASVVFVPPRFAKGAVVEAVEAGIGLIVVITEGIPVADSAYFVELALQRGVRIIGPNCPGLLTLPSQENEHGVNLGIIPDGIVGRGPIGLVSKSGTLTYQLMGELSDIGFTACLGVGGDPIVGTTLREALQEFEQDADTKAVVMIGEIGGSAEQDAAAWAAEHMTKPVVAYIAGFTAPEGKQMGHAGAIVSGGKGTAQDKKIALEAAGIPVGRTPGQTADLMRKVLAERSLVVISMEEGGENLSSSTLDMTRIVVLLSQGIGFETDSLSLSIMPLLLTVLLIGLVWSFSRKICTDIRAYVSGVVVWIVINVMGTQSLPVGLLDWPALVCVKSAVVFSLGFAGAALSKGPLSGQLRELIRHHVSDGVRRTIRTGLMVGVIMMGVYLVMGLITVIVWGVLNRSAMDSLFADIGMGTGSRILTTIASLAWLPNLCIWAVSWLFGAGFHIGELATFTLWIGQGRSLPPLPVFGLLPQAVVAGLASMAMKSGFRIIVGSASDPLDRKDLILELAYPAGGFCLSSVVISLLSSIMFGVSNGSLGKARLKYVGVDVMQSAQAVGRPSAMGLCMAWVLALIGVAIVFGIRWIARRTGAQRAATTHPRTIVSRKSIQPTTKKEHDDQHESTDTTGSGVRLP